MTRDHWVEVELGDDVPRDRPLWLVAHGWIHPTDSSINVAIGQGQHAQPQGLVLEVPTADGGWTVARPDLGFPAGKNKTILVDLDGIFRPGVPPALPAADEPGDLLGFARRRRRRCPRSPLKIAAARPAIGRAAAPRLFADDPGRRQLARAAATTTRSPAPASAGAT